MKQKTWLENIPYPKGLFKWLYKTPILLYRLGLGFLVGRLFMILTTIGRKSGRPRRTAIEFHQYKGRRYVFSAWGTKADWYRNIEANPWTTIQTWRGAESVIAHRITSDTELAEAFAFAMSNPSMRMVMKSAGFNLTLEGLLAQKERFTFVTFDPTDHSTPEPLRSDLAWVWGLLLPLALTATTGIVFRATAQWLGKDAAYLLGFSFYWLFWCLLVPGLVFKKEGVGSLLKDQKPLFTSGNWLAGMLWIIVTATALAMYGRDFIHAPWIMILLAIPLATINGICEELLWRGLYVRAFPDNPWLGVIVPATGFALWHFVPQTINPAENGAGFVLSTLFLGLAYGYIAYRTGSAKWTAISHSLSGIMALSGYLAPSVLALIT
jgi:deazaflavin-dependent oxidoreductase (nitroreductase family)